LTKTAAHMLDRQAKRVKKRGRAALSQNEGDLHRLRIALKKLRYTAEFFAPLHPKVQVRQHLRQIKDLQDHLGQLNDATTVRSLTKGLVRRGGEYGQEAAVRTAAAALVNWYEAQTPKAVRQALKRYDRLSKLTPYWR